MKLLRSFVLFGVVLAVPALLGVGGVSAPPGEKADRAGAGGSQTAPADRPKMSPFKRSSALRDLAGIERGRLLEGTWDMYLASDRHGPIAYLVVNVEFETAEACNKAFPPNDPRLLARIDRFADVFLNGRRALEQLEKMDGVRWIEVAGKAQAPPPGVIEQGETTRERAEGIIRGGIDVKETGKGVLIAIVDSGIDFRHPDFITYAAGKPLSRILYYWDTFADAYTNTRPERTPPVKYPNGKYIGAVYSQKELTAAIRGELHIPVWDTDGHGTACAGIAAGNGNAAEGDLKKDKMVIGVAPEADLLVVRVSRQRNIENSYLLGAICDWVAEIARERNEPFVISCSFGGTYGSHDGTQVEERALDARFPPARKGGAICIAAGNEGVLEQHAEMTGKSEQEKERLAWIAPERGVLTLCYDTKNKDDLRLNENFLSRLGLDETQARQVVQTMTYVSNVTGLAVTELPLPPSRMDPLFGSQEDTLSLYTVSGEPVKVHAYLHGTKAKFTSKNARPGRQIGSPAAAAHAITVGSYDWNGKFHRQGQYHDYRVGKKTPDGFVKRQACVVGALSAYSNPGGPHRGDEYKPDIVAPGQWFSAAAPANVDAYRDTTGRYRMFNGTSAATPYTAGVVALMLQKNPDLTLRQIKDLLHSKAQTAKDIQTGNLPNVWWGHGKLNRKVVKAILEAVPPAKGKSE